MTENLQAEVEVLQKIRLLSLIGRGTQFLELGRHKEALLDFQHSLQVSPGKRLILVKNTSDFHKFVLCSFAVFSREFLCFIPHLFRCQLVGPLAMLHTRDTSAGPGQLTAMEKQT